MHVYAIDIDSERGKRFREAEAIARIDELSGRSIGRYIVRTAIPSAARDHRRGYRASAYVAADAYSEARNAGVRGFKVRREDADRELDAALFRGAR